MDFLVDVIRMILTSEVTFRQFVFSLIMTITLGTLGILFYVTPKGGLSVNFGRIKIEPQKKHVNQLDKNNKNKEKTTDSGNDTGDGN